MVKDKEITINRRQNTCSCCCEDDGPLDIKEIPRNENKNTPNDHRIKLTYQWNNGYLPVLISLILLLTGILMDHYFSQAFFNGTIQLVWYIIAYFPVGFPVLKKALGAIIKGDVFTEFLLMSIATLGAFAIGQYPEGVAVMVFYAIGEQFQSAAVRKAKNSIKALMDVLPPFAMVLRNKGYEITKPENVNVGEIIQIKAGEKVPLDGEMLSEGSSFNTSALTGESKPKFISRGEQVLAGMLNQNMVVELKVSKRFADSSLAKILDLVQNAASKKAKTELLIRRFARIYTPIVFFLAVALVVIPYFVLPAYSFSEWFYRGLIFLVISCPCALVISIPLGYFGGIGAASRNGILFKGSNFLELITKVNTIVLDKTGTLTAGVFKVQKIQTVEGVDKNDFMDMLAALESKSNHPVSKAISEYAETETKHWQVTDIQEVPGHGLKGKVNDKEIVAGNTRLLQNYNIQYDTAIDSIEESMVAVAIGNHYAGYVLIADELKKDARESIAQMHHNGIQQVIMLSGDKNAITQRVAQDLGIDIAFGDLLPEQKVRKIEELKQDRTRIIAFVGDGINDTPVLALSDVGVAMGAMGSDAAIETADVVIQTDQPSKILTAIKIGKATKKIVIQNITLAFAVKLAVLTLGAGGMATMWEAVFADVGVALLAIMNAVRIQRMKF